MIFKVENDNWRKIGVYSITNNINNKIYIGSTTSNFRHRYIQYCSAVKKELNTQPVLHRAFKKYGFENFTFEIVCICNQENVLLMEQFYINKGTDYNSCLIAGSLQGYKHPEDSKTRTIIKGNHHCAIKINMYSLNNEFIKDFTSITEAQDYTNIKSKSNISQCCKGKVFSAGGYRWSYANEPLKDRRKREFGTVKVALLKDDFYKEFHSQVECCEYLKSIGNTNCNQGLINRALKNNIKVYNFNIKKI
jgi:group I intron endonuclease